MTRTSSTAGPSPAGGGPVPSLTDREIDVLRRVADGQLMKDISADLFLSPTGLSSLLSRTSARLGAANTVHAVHVAGRLGLLDPPPSVDMPAELVEVLVLVAAGSTNAEVGRSLGRSEYWAAERMRTIMRRLGARDRAHAVALAIGGGVIRPPRPEQNAA
ncbi:LuxR C-terminal-related transcriptional regulator [Streptomyces hydrogenans]|uniref:LuxR C-terminal-related transcriptional regulator n=1 Tax=Streptomyces hydrogenans TaxID=1873719 RepID=UPI0036EA49FB